MSHLDVLAVSFILGALGQVGRAIVALTGKSMATGIPGQDDVFRLARLGITIIIGGFAGVATALAFILNGKSLDDNGVLIAFLIAGYTGTDVIEALVGDYLAKWVWGGKGEPATPITDTVRQPSLVSSTTSARALDDLDASLSKLTDLQARFVAKPALLYSTILARAKSWFAPDPAKAKDTDAVPAQPNDNSTIDFVRGLFGTIQFDPNDVFKLNFSSYANFAHTVGLLFRLKGGTFDDA